MDSSSYKERFKARFAIWWPRLIPLMVFVYLFDIGTRFLTGTPMKAATINAYIAIPVVTLLLTVMLAVISPIFPPIITVFKKITSNKLGALLMMLVGVGLIIYIFGWWSLGFLVLLLILDRDKSDSSTSDLSPPDKSNYQAKLDAGTNRAKEIADAKARWENQNGS